MSRRGGKLRRTSLFAGVILVVLLLATAMALAQESRLDGKVRTGDEVVIPAGETVEGNLYAFAGNVSIAGTVNGDLVATAGQVTISGTVNGDALVVTGRADVTGEIRGDLRVASGQTTVSGTVAGDVLLATGQGTVSGRVGQDLIFGAGQLSVSGSVEGSVLGGAGDYRRAGTVGGTEDVAVGQPAKPRAQDRVVAGVARFVSILAIAALALWLIPKAVQTATDRATGRPLASLGFGLLGIVAIAVLLGATILVGVLVSIGLGLLQLFPLVGTFWFAFATGWMLLVFVVFVVAMFGAPVVVAITGANLVLRAGEPSWGSRFGALALGLVVLVIVTAIPLIGGLIGFLVFLFGLGAIILAVRNFGAKEQPEGTGSIDVGE